MKRALIIEDDPDIAETVRYNLASEGFATRVALTGEEGLSLALDRKNTPSLIILDLMLPGMATFAARSNSTIECWAFCGTVI